MPEEITHDHVDKSPEKPASKNNGAISTKINILKEAHNNPAQAEDKPMDESSKRQRELRDTAAKLGLDESESRSVLEGYEKKAGIFKNTREKLVKIKNYMRLAIGAISLMGLAADSKDQLDFARFAAELNAPDSGLSQFIEPGRQAALEEKIEDTVVLVGKKNITDNLDVEKKEKTADFNSLKAVNEMIHEKKPLVTLHTHPVDPVSTSEEIAKSGYDYNGLVTMDRDQFIKAYENAASGKAEFYSIAPSNRDVVMKFVIDYYQNQNAVPRLQNIVFEVSGVWGFGVNLDHPYWKRANEIMKSSQFPTTDNELNFIILEILLDPAYIDSLTDYQTEQLKLLTPDAVAASSKHGPVGEFVQTAEKRFGVNMQYAPYSLLLKHE